MRCPFCRNTHSSVVDSRTVEEGTAIRRRRECDKCRKRFTSYERTAELMPLITKRDGRREPFDRNKLLGGLMRACQKRPVAKQALEALADGLEGRLMEDGGTEVASVELGEWVMEGLRALDEVAYVRFASVYRHFADVTEFADEIEKLRPRSAKEGPARAKKPGQAEA